MRRLLPLIPLIAACSPVAHIGGTTDPNDPAVVLVIAQSNQGSSLCTGEVISPHVVLTAAHCVDPAVVGNGNTFSIFLGYDINDNAQNINSNFVLAKSVDWDHQFNQGNLQGGHDVGIVVAGRAINVTPLPFNHANLDNNFNGAPLRIVGYGISSGSDQQGTTAGTKRQAMTQVNQLYQAFIYLGDAQHNTCEGDSGGPAFAMLNGIEQIVGITSFGDQGCTMGGYDTRVDQYAAFIDDYIQQNDPNGMMNPPPDMAQPMMPPPDMAMTNPFGSHDAGVKHGDMAGQLGGLGDLCSMNADCLSHLCASEGSTGFCTQPCDPTNPNSCPSPLVCGAVGTDHICMPQSHGATGGCAVARDHAPSTPLAIAFALTLLWLARRRENA